MTKDRPSNMLDYRKWLRKEHDVTVNGKMSNHFDTMARKACSDFEKSTFWSNVGRSMQTFNEEYLLKTSYPLFVDPTKPPSFVIKSFDSFLLKTFRNNIARNPLWPNPPQDGWLLPSNWISRGNDIVRTCFTVKYLDGVEFLIEKLTELAGAQSLEFKKYYVAGTDGYYAAHVYILDWFEVPSIEFDTERLVISVELQITSQLQEAIRRLLHQHFEERRTIISPPDTEWQWNYKSDEFSTNYLGHILHYVEGMIMEVRDRHDRKRGRDKL